MSEKADWDTIKHLFHKLWGNAANDKATYDKTDWNTFQIQLELLQRGVDSHSRRPPLRAVPDNPSGLNPWTKPLTQDQLLDVFKVAWAEANTALKKDTPDGAVEMARKLAVIDTIALLIETAGERLGH